MGNNNPSLRPENNGTLSGALNVVMNKFMQSIDGVMPARVVAYDPGTPAVVQVQPLIKIAGTSGESFSRGQVASVPVCQIGGGGFLLNFSLSAGDIGLLIASDRDISNFMETGQESAPNTFRIKSFSDGFFLPIVLDGYTPATEGVSLQNYDGSVKISLDSSQININGLTELFDSVIIDGDLTVNGKIRVIGDLNCGGNITAAGSITPSTPLPPP